MACINNKAAWCDKSLLMKRKQFRFDLTFLHTLLTLKLNDSKVFSFFNFLDCFIIYLYLKSAVNWPCSKETNKEQFFLTFRVKWDGSSHLEMLSKACVRCCPARAEGLADTWRTVSSAFSWQLTSCQQSGRSLMYVPNGNGPKTDPCGTPMSLEQRLDLIPFTLTHCCLPSKYDLNHIDDILKSGNNLFIKILRSTVSNAFFRSRNTAPTTWPLSSEPFIFSTK